MWPKRIERLISKIRVGQNIIVHSKLKAITCIVIYLAITK